MADYSGWIASEDPRRCRRRRARIPYGRPRPRPFYPMAVSNKTKIPVGTILAGKYRITREIGRGGMATVHEAENIDIGKRIAIKVLAQELTGSSIVVERFLREARAAAAIRSPYICDVYDSGKLPSGQPFLVLELLEGESLYERMTRQRQLDVQTTVQVITQVCRGLTKAHAASIVHRDLKPENIFLTKDEEGHLLAKILDFGLAKFYTPTTKDQTRLTRGLKALVGIAIERLQKPCLERRR